ncbi:MAG: hypothetical protein JST26_08955 [Bacteroidetes bacterium]|nr:hypothetical protein [Bacteroidota bacterium]
MKAFFLMIFCVVCFMGAKAQDTIYFKSGEFATGKVLEVTPGEVKYKKSQVPDGPVYTSYKSDVALIQYKNGYKEVFSTTPSNMPSVPQPVNIPSKPEEVKEAKASMEPELRYYPYGNHHRHPVEKPKQ